MDHWKSILNKSLVHPRELAKRFGCDPGPLLRVARQYPMRINPYYLGLIRGPGDPLWRQAVPDEQELADAVGLDDPLAEEALSPVPNLVHKYPDRALFLVSSQCAMYCRFCTRKRKVGTVGMLITDDTIRAGLDYLAQTPEIRDVLVSGGDPLLLDDERLEEIIAALRRIKTIEVIRIGTRVPCTLPMRITKSLVRMLSRYHPLYINTHFNHPEEITSHAAKACALLADAGISLGCQTVLLKGVNDDPVIMKELMNSLLRIRVKPYYIFQADLTRGTNHFQTPIAQGLKIISGLWTHCSSLALPVFALDAPGGGGKIPLFPRSGTCRD